MPGRPLCLQQECMSDACAACVRSDDVTPSFWGTYDRTVCVGSLSKAFGLPGLRIGWIVAPPELLEQVRKLVGGILSVLRHS